jgi:predicted Zn-dependent protease
MIRLASSKFLSLLLLTGLGLGACQTAPATGEKVISFNSREEEKRIGMREHPNILREFNGEYDDAKVQAYVNNLGQKLARVSELPNIGWTFTVLNSKGMNAFALPGGFIYVTRGLLSLASNEAELAGVLSHEIGHVTALHSSRRQAGGTLAGLTTIAAGLLLGQAGSQVANTVGYASVQRYSQGQEFEADSLGVRYLSRGNYNTRTMADFLAKMREHAKLENRLAGRPAGNVDSHSIFASHPRTVERVEKAVKEATNARSGPNIGETEYINAMSGLIYGDDPASGVIQGNSFIHPILRFRFDVPKGFTLINQPQAVFARGPARAIIKFDMEAKRYTGAMDRYLPSAMPRNVRLNQLERLTVNGMEGATAATQLRTEVGLMDIRLVALRDSNGRIYRFMFQTPPRMTNRLSLGLRQTTFSLRPISSAEANAVKYQRIEFRTVRAGETVQTYVNQMAVKKFPEETFRVMNGLKPGQGLTAGQRVKIVTQG